MKVGFVVDLCEKHYRVPGETVFKTRPVSRICGLKLPMMAQCRVVYRTKSRTVSQKSCLSTLNSFWPSLGVQLWNNSWIISVDSGPLRREKTTNCVQTTNYKLWVAFFTRTFGIEWKNHLVWLVSVNELLAKEYFEHITTDHKKVRNNESKDGKSAIFNLKNMDTWKTLKATFFDFQDSGKLVASTILPYL